MFAAAVILPEGFRHPLLNDSKQMSEKSRDILREVIEKEAVAWAVEEVSAEEIDSLNILWASVEGMQRAVRRLASIAAASVLAKTRRDEKMRELDRRYPQYGWAHNMGYPTPEHIEAIRRYGLTPEHRRSFHPKALEPSLFDI